MNDVPVEVMIEVRCPRVPNFLMIDDQRKVALHELSEDSLREIGAEWTARLIARAKEQRDGDVVDMEWTDG